MTPISLQDVANIITFIAPGYFAIQIYAIRYAKKPRDFSHLLIESVVFSLPIVAVADLLWRALGQKPTDELSATYALLVLGVAVLAGIIATYVRVHWPVKQLAKLWNLGSPDEDFVRLQFERLDVKNPDKSGVAVTLKSGVVFSGTPSYTNRYTPDGLKYYYFNNLAWFDKKTQKWQEREGGIIVERSEIEYIETRKLTDD